MAEPVCKVCNDEPQACFKSICPAADPAQSAPSAEMEFLELDKRLQVDVKSEGDEHTPARWDVVYCHPETRQNVRFRNDNDAATQRVQVRGMIRMYADAYAALRTAQLERDVFGYQAAVESYKEQNRELMRGLESLTPSGSEFVNDPEACIAYVKKARRSLHEIVKKSIIEKRAAETRAETAESAQRDAKKLAIQECADLVNHLPVSDWCKCGVYKDSVSPDQVATQTVVYVYEALQRHALTVAAQTPEEKP